MGLITLVNVSIVVAAEHHNPTILHPLFLESQHIVPTGWEVTDGPICTPAFSSVGYANDIVFRAEQSRLQIIDGNPIGNGTSSPVSELASKYVEKLPHVQYKAVGVNFIAFSECEDSEHHLLERFLKTGTWNSGTLSPVSMGIQLTYQIASASLNLSLKPGRSQSKNEDAAKPGIVFEGNCHSDAVSISEVLHEIDGYKQKLTEAWAICKLVIENDEAE